MGAQLISAIDIYILLLMGKMNDFLGKLKGDYLDNFLILCVAYNKSPQNFELPEPVYITQHIPFIVQMVGSSPGEWKG